MNLCLPGPQYEGFDLRANGWQKYPKSTLLVSSAGRGWSTISAELRAHPAGPFPSYIQHNIEIVIAVTGTDDGLVVRNCAGRHQESNSKTRTIWLAPIGVHGEECVISAAIPGALHLYLPVRQFDLLADQYNVPRSQAHSIQYMAGLHDDLIYELGASVLSELMNQTAAGRMLAETSSLMLAARLSHNYADGELIDVSAGPSCRLENARLRRVLDYIEQNLEEEVTVAGLSDLANLSMFHFTRMFTAAVGVAPHRYVSRRRLDHAKTLLGTGKLSLSEIAHRACFSSQASFSRAFRRATGLAPGEYRRVVR